MSLMFLKSEVRPRWLRAALVTAVSVIVLLPLAACGGASTGGSGDSGDQEIDTGWTLGYEPISKKSIDFLKSKDWWPLPVGTQPGFSSEPVWEPLDLAGRRGLEIETTYFASGPEINEAAASGRVAVGMEGNFPFTSLMANNLPVEVIAVLNPNLRHALLVPTDSPIESAEDLKELDKPVIGVVSGSSGEFYLQTMLEEIGLTSKDVVLRNLTPQDMLLLPEGLDAVVQWEPHVTTMTVDRENARIVDTIYPYNFYMGNLWIRKEIRENAPDVAQALSDMFIEGLLYTRENPEEAKKLYKANPVYAQFSDSVMEVLVDRLTNVYKPTMAYPFEEFWATENARVAEFLEQTGRLNTPVTAEDWKDRFNPEFFEDTASRLGWNIPETPPWIPKDWEGEVGNPPYPPYLTPEDEPQGWPAPGDLKE